MQIDSQLLLFGALILLISFLLSLILVLIVRRNIRNDRMSKMITMQQAAFRTESASTLDRMRTTAKECQQNVEASTQQAEDMVKQISDSLRTLSDYQEDLAALQSVCAEYKNALEKLRSATDQVEARISVVQQEVNKIEAVNEKMDSFRQEVEISMNQLQDLKAEYVRLVAATQESLKTAAENQKSENASMLSDFSSQMERTREAFASFVSQERADFKTFSDSELKKAETLAVDTENRRDSIIRSLEEGKTELEEYRSELASTLDSLTAIRDGIKSEGENAALLFSRELDRKRSEAAAETDSSISSAKNAIEELARQAVESLAEKESVLKSNAESLTGQLGEISEEKKNAFTSFIEEQKHYIEASLESVIARFEEERGSLSSALEALGREQAVAADNTKETVAEALRNIENARFSLDNDRTSFIETSREAVSKSFSEMLEGVNQRYERMKSDADAFVKAIADRINDTRETITLLSQGEQERIQDSVERLQELDRKIRISEEQLQKLSETITSTREELFSAQQDRGRLDSEIEERNKTLSMLNDEMQKSKSARISEEAALVRLKLQISNLEKERKKAEQSKEEPKASPAVQQKKPEEMIEEFPDDIFTGNVEEVNLDDDE
ncbi:MAG: hypothetical protein IAA97_03145 [Spirochaetes bacterium]|uniref:Uncharacterized protein n=1 Tax=Candidatus Ornithospirochaeta stercoripullorum TaxID=2840899 RepID=A0A9D9E142_9SPIO|nr:hypothetical protein [Candidatus Ornithospirochaeta stercoripullorum]